MITYIYYTIRKNTCFDIFRRNNFNLLQTLKNYNVGIIFSYFLIFLL